MGANLQNILDNTSEQEKEIIMKAVSAASAGKIRKYRIDISENIWYDVDNGIVVGSSRHK